MPDETLEILEQEIELDTRAAVHAQADTMGILLSALFRSGDLTREQVRWVVDRIGRLGQQASGDSNPVRRMEGVMLRVIAGQLDDATQNLSD